MTTTRSNRGRALEALVLASQGPGVAITQVPNGVRWLRGGNTCPTKSPVDFFVTVNGRAVVFDTKRCAVASRFPVGNPDHVTPAQVAEVVRHGRAGAVAGLLVENVKAETLHWLDWQQVRSPPPLSPSLPWEHLVVVGDVKHAIDWRRVVAAGGGEVQRGA
jgi:penicillin-binding protein-related factor A (putative recombinase)